MWLGIILTAMTQLPAHANDCEFEVADPSFAYSQFLIKMLHDRELTPQEVDQLLVYDEPANPYQIIPRLAADTSIKKFIKERVVNRLRSGKIKMPIVRSMAGKALAESRDEQERQKVSYRDTTRVWGYIPLIRPRPALSLTRGDFFVDRKGQIWESDGEMAGRVWIRNLNTGISRSLRPGSGRSLRFFQEKSGRLLLGFFNNEGVFVYNAEDGTEILKATQDLTNLRPIDHTKFETQRLHIFETDAGTEADLTFANVPGPDLANRVAAARAVLGGSVSSLVLPKSLDDVKGGNWFPVEDQGSPTFVYLGGGRPLQIQGDSENPGNTLSSILPIEVDHRVNAQLGRLSASATGISDGIRVSVGDILRATPRKNYDLHRSVADATFIHLDLVADQKDRYLFAWESVKKHLVSLGVVNITTGERHSIPFSDWDFESPVKTVYDPVSDAIIVLLRDRNSDFEYGRIFGALK